MAKNKHDEDEKKRDQVRLEAAMKFGMVAVYSLSEASKLLKCDCELCGVRADVVMHTAVLACAGAEAIQGRREVLEEINTFMETLVKKYRDLLPK